MNSGRALAIGIVAGLAYYLVSRFSESWEEAFTIGVCVWLILTIYVKGSNGGRDTKDGD